MQDRITGLVRNLEPNQIFVFGSNEAGRHGRGAAKTALSFGAKYGIGEGLAGHTYGIPTKNKQMQVLSINRIKKYVDTFIEFAKVNPQYTFLVTQIGCGLAGYVPNQIAPLFIEAVRIKNIWLPKAFWEIINRKNKIFI
jgi:hypothetical protein